jgi:hypothetical protein
VSARDTLINWGLTEREADDVLAEHTGELVPALGSVREGSVWVWEPLKASATETVRVTSTRWNGEEWWVEAELLRHHAGIAPRRWNELSRFVEAAVLREAAPDTTPGART